MYRNAKAQKNGFEAAIMAVNKYMETNNKYPTAEQLIKWCAYQNPKIKGVQHRFASIIIPILKYREYKFCDYTRDHLCQFIYDYTQSQSGNINTDINKDVLKIQKCIMDYKIDGKTFNKMKKTEWIQKLNDYFISKDVAKTYYNIIKKHEREQNEKYAVIIENNSNKNKQNPSKSEEITDNSTNSVTPLPSTIKHSSISNNDKSIIETDFTEAHIEEKMQKPINNTPNYMDKLDELKQEGMIAVNENIYKDEIESISINSAVQHEIESLKNENVKLKKEIKKLNCSEKEICKLNLQELNELETKLKNGLNVIYEVKEKLYKSRFYCILCEKNQKNVLINQCNHFVLCSECEKKLEPRKCPICRVRFTQTTKLKL
eukprot:270401_1